MGPPPDSINFDSLTVSGIDVSQPALGEHSELLREMLGDQEYERLKAAGVIGG